MTQAGIEHSTHEVNIRTPKHFFSFNIWWWLSRPEINLSSSSSCHPASTDLPDPLSPPVSIVHRSREVFKATYCISRCSSWSSCLCSSVWMVHRSISLMRSSLLLQQCLACLVRLTLIVFVMGGRWSYSCCFVWGVASRTCSKYLAAFLCNCYQAFLHTITPKTNFFFLFLYNFFDRWVFMYS